MKTPVFVVLFVLCWGLPALAGKLALSPDTVAILEYRNGVSQMPDLAGRIAEDLSRNTSLLVIAPQEGRRRLSARLDAQVARCAGEPACLSAIGGRLGAGEVLLVAVSQLGDVVLALQRINVRGAKVTGRVADSIATGQSVGEVQVLGWLQQLYPPDTFKRYGQIRVTTDVQGAQVYINAKARGTTPLQGPVQVLAPGNYRLLVEKARYLPFQASLTVMPDSTVEVAARLPPEAVATPWYKRWYVWAAIGGVAVVAVGGVAIYYGAFNHAPVDKTHVPGTIGF
jgi:hypothetical protein